MKNLKYRYRALPSLDPGHAGERKSRLNIVLHSESFLGKEDWDWFLKVVPRFLFSEIDRIEVNTTEKTSLLTSYYKPDRTFAVYIPDTFSGSKHLLLKEIAVMVQAIDDYGYIPRAIPLARMHRYLTNWAKISKPVLLKPRETQMNPKRVSRFRSAYKFSLKNPFGKGED